MFKVACCLFFALVVAEVFGSILVSGRMVMVKIALHGSPLQGAIYPCCCGCGMEIPWDS